MEDYSREFEENGDFRREWMNKITNEEFKQDFIGHQIRVKIDFYLNVCKLILRKTTQNIM